MMEGLMRIRQDVWDAYEDKDTDNEAALFVEQFDEPPGRVLEVGGNDCPLALALAYSGFSTTSIDLRPYREFARVRPHPNHRHVVGNFCSLPPEVRGPMLGAFDCVVSVSAIEHFGLGTYSEAPCPNDDIIAMRHAYDALRPGGVCYLLVPFGGKYCAYRSHWRVYDWPSVLERLVQRFIVNRMWCWVSEEGEINGIRLIPRNYISWEVIMLNQGNFPGMSLLLRMIK